MAASERTQEATALRRRQAEREGFVPQWRDLRLLLWVTAVWGSLVLFFDSTITRLRQFMDEVLAAIAGTQSMTTVLARSGEVMLHILAPPLVLVFAAATLPMLVRRPAGLHPHAILRNPFRDAFSERARVDLVWSFAKAMVLLLVFLGVVGMLAQGLSSIPLHTRLDLWPVALRKALESALARSVVAMLVLAPLGLWIERLMHRKALRMSVEEQRRERMREEVDPRVALELRRRSRVQESDFDATLQAATHGLAAPGMLILLQLELDDSISPRLLVRLSGAPMQAAQANLLSRRVPIITHLALVQRLVPVAAGSVIPRAYYPALATLIAKTKTSDDLRP